MFFDLDGTLVDSRRDIAEALNSALAVIERRPLPIEAILPMIGDGARALVARALASGGSAPSDAFVERTRVLFERAYEERPCVHTTLLPGAREAMSIDVPRAVVTNKPRRLAVLVLEGLAIGHAFQMVRAGGDGPMKPSPDGIVAVARALDVALDRVWFVGDGPQDVLAGRAAGCFTVAVPGIADRARVLAAKPDRVVDSLEELARLAKGNVTSA